MFICSARSSLLAAGLSAVALLFGCAEPQRMVLPEPLPEPPRETATGSEPSSTGPSATFERTVKLPVLKVADWSDTGDKRWDDLPLPDGDFDLNVDSIPLHRFVHVALGEVLGLSFDVDPSVANRNDQVTLRISKAVNAQRFLGMIEQTLAGYEVGLAMDAGYLKVLPSKKLLDLPPVPVNLGNRGLALTHGRIITIIPLSFTRPGEVMGFAKYYLKMGTGADVYAMNRLNSVMVIGEPARINRFADVVAMVDRPAMADRHLELVRTVYWKSNEIKPLLEDALKAQGVVVANQADQAGVFISAVQRLNALLIAAPNRETVEWIVDWIERLDTPEAAGESVQSFIYFARNSNAKDLGNIVSQVLGQARRGSGSAGTSTGGDAESAGTGAAEGGPRGLDLRVVVDETRNSLVFVGGAGDYSVAYQLLQELDIPAKQVLIEVTIADISLDKTRQLGVEWQFIDYNAQGEINRVVSTLGGLGAGTAGLLFTSFDNRGDIEMRLNALAEDGDARILSSPKLLAVDNEEARIQVGEQIAVITSEIADTNSPGAGGADNVLRSFEYIDTGVILSFTPTVMADGVVRMDIYQEVSSAGASLNNTPPISKRTIETTLTAHSGQTIMIGGLMTRNTTSQQNKVPLLGDIPLLGNLFKSSQETDTSSEMIVLITPHVIESAAQADALTRAFRDQLDW